MKINSASRYSSSSTTAPLNSETDPAKPKEILYPYQIDLKNILDPTCIFWTTIIVSLIGFYAESFYNSEDFFYPCNYTNFITVDDTLQLKSRLSENQKLIEIYKSSLPTSDITESERKNYDLKNAIAVLNREYDYHKTHWTKCFEENCKKFNQKIVICLLSILIYGITISVYKTFKSLQHFSKLKHLDLTDAQKESYENDWNSMTGFRNFLILHSFSIILYISLFMNTLLRTYPRELPFF